MKTLFTLITATCIMIIAIDSNSAKANKQTNDSVIKNSELKITIEDKRIGQRPYDIYTSPQQGAWNNIEIFKNGQSFKQLSFQKAQAIICVDKGDIYTSPQKGAWSNIEIFKNAKSFKQLSFQNAQAIISVD